MAVHTFESTYSDNPWAALETKTRVWYVPFLLDIWRKYNVFTPFITMVIDMLAVRTNQVVFSQMYDLEPNTDPIGLRDLWLPSMYTDSNSRVIICEHHAGKLGLHRYDDYITYWEKNPGRAGIAPIIGGLLGRSIADHYDILGRNAFAQGPYQLFMNDRADFSEIVAGDLFDVDLLNEVWLGLSYREAPFALQPEGPKGDIIAITTPGVLNDIRRQAAADGNWKSAAEYAGNLGMLIRNIEVGRCYNTRIMQSVRNTLYNCGAITAQVAVSAPVVPGEGSYALVDDVITPGQPTATRYVQMAGPVTAFAGKEGQIVTLHRTRTSDFGVTDGVDYRAGDITNRRLENVDEVNNRLSFDKPVLKLDFEEDLGGGVYGYVTLGRHIHLTTCLGGPDGVVSGVTQPPMTHTPPTIDDTMSMQRFSWNGYTKYQTFKPDRFEVLVSAGNVRFKGASSPGG